MNNTNAMPSYTMLSNFKYVIKNMWQWKKQALIVGLLQSPIVVINSFLGIFLLREIVFMVETSRAPNEILLTIGIVSGVIIVASVIEKMLNGHIEKFMMQHDYLYQKLILEKSLSSDYTNMESPKGLTRVSKALGNTRSDNGSTRLMIKTLSSLGANLIGIIFFAIILFSLNPLILLVLVVTILLTLPVSQLTTRWNYKNKDNWQTYDRKLNYLREKSGDFSMAKDLRLYKMSAWFKNVFSETLQKRVAWHKKEQRAGLLGDVIRLLLALFRNGFCYVILIYLVYAQGLAVADFIFFFGIIAGFSVWMNGFVTDMGNFYKFHLGFTEIRECLDYPDSGNTGKGIPLPDDTFDIEFENVSFRYPLSKSDTLHNLNFKIKKGQKLAIVGLNGAGKTTLVKLLCGLYEPTEGKILINGHPINSYNREQYFSLFSVVFQTIFFLPMPIAQNVSASVKAETDTQRAKEALELAGLLEKANSLPQRIDTRIIKMIHPDAVNLSGGEMQKLALARSIYKEGKALVLDEPTSALDPIAENNIYMEYKKITANRTSVFISHRLASTRFCDIIFFLKDANIAEQGTHEELMAQKGEYFNLFETQSKYYKNQKTT
ncbi:MAG: ABC transporter ATP-binding protein/permease [Defluviitaleaceae bacterium]|nr:ABC transporter ATP-binding protein/permease [Defluviitaleaceae bacterium]